MVKDGVRTLERGPEALQSASVYDFLYQDGRRIGSFLSQFVDAGHLKEVKQSSNLEKAAKSGTKSSIKGGIPGVVGGLMEAEESTNDTSMESGERVYDPLWSNALALLDYLEKGKLLNRDIATAYVGQFVIASGSLSILNAPMLPKLFESENIRAAARSQVEKIERVRWNNNPKNAKLEIKTRRRRLQNHLKQIVRNTQAELDVLMSFPLSVQCVIGANEFSVWSTLTEGGMVGTVADLCLKHGTEIPGVWHLFGVVDALPSPTPISDEVTYTPDHFDDLIKYFANVGRHRLGRPDRAFGMTALLLFRKVTGSETGG